MQLQDFQAGQVFAFAGEYWLCSDVGAATVAALRLTDRVQEDTLRLEHLKLWKREPPYLSPQMALHPEDWPSCRLVASGLSAEQTELPGPWPTEENLRVVLDAARRWEAVDNEPPRNLVQGLVESVLRTFREPRELLDGPRPSLMKLLSVLAELLPLARKTGAAPPEVLLRLSAELSLYGRECRRLDVMLAVMPEILKLAPPIPPEKQAEAQKLQEQMEHAQMDQLERELELKELEAHLQRLLKEKGPRAPEVKELNLQLWALYRILGYQEKEAEMDWKIQTWKGDQP